MPASKRFPRIPLPSGWPLQARSALVHAISLAHASLVSTHSWAANSWNARIRLQTENDRLRQEVHLLQEEMRIRNSRMASIPAQRRPHYRPMERLAILELRAARGWSLSETARHLLITTATMASWTARLDERGTRAIVRTREPANKFPDFVGYVVRRLKVLCRAGLHLGPTTVKRMLKVRPRRGPRFSEAPAERRVFAKHPNHVWHVDLTTVPTSLGYWISWTPFALPQRWPFCWWLAVAVDHYSRRLMGLTVYDALPDSMQVQAFLGRTIRNARSAPKHLISDHGVQFTAEAFGRWCRRRSIHQRFGAIGKYGNIAVVERFIRSLKSECIRRWVIVPYERKRLRRELALYTAWYNDDRPHYVRFRSRRKHLPIVELKTAA